VITPSLLQQAEALLNACRTRSVKLSIAEGCTGGLVAAVLTAIPGSSDVLERGFVAYSNQAKSDLLGVPSELISDAGAVSEPVAQRMAEGALTRSDADIAVSLTGVLGPGGGSAEKPLGLVCFGLAQRGRPITSEHQNFAGERTAIRMAAAERALALISAALTSETRNQAQAQPGVGPPSPRTT
jgi:nicotinamide-nucleotide amidase